MKLLAYPILCTGPFLFLFPNKMGQSFDSPPPDTSIPLNRKTTRSPQRWGHWPQSATRRWFRSAWSGPGCAGCWPIRPAPRLVCRSPPERSLEIQQTQATTQWGQRWQLEEKQFGCSKFSASVYLKLKEELVKYGGLSKSRIPRQLRTSFMVGRVEFSLSMTPLWMGPSLVPLQRVTSWLYSSKLRGRWFRISPWKLAGISFFLTFPHPALTCCRPHPIWRIWTGCW